MTRGGVPLTVTPSQFPIARSADQSSVAVPASVSRADSNESQSATRPGLLAGSGTAMPLAQGDGWADAADGMLPSKATARRNAIALSHAAIPGLLI